MPDPGGEEIIPEPDKPTIMCAKCNTEMQKIDDNTYKCPKCGLVYKRAD